MSPRKLFFVISIIVSALCLAVGFGIDRQWLGALIAILMVPAWLFAQKYASTWLPFLCLIASVSLAVAGRLIGALSLLMIFSTAFSLAAWDLLSLNAAIVSNSTLDKTRKYEKKHIQSLGLALLSGLSAALLGRLFTIHIPFALLVIIIVLVVFCLDRALGYIKKRRISSN